MMLHKILQRIYFAKEWPKINIHTKTNMIIYKLNCRTYLQQWNYSMQLGEREKGKKNDRASTILHTIRCEGRGYEDVY
jgi:hypothetical protein